MKLFSFCATQQFNYHESTLFLDHKPQKHVLRPEDSVGMSNTCNNVRNLEWDPLSVEYLLVATAQCTILLVDSVSASPVMCFEQPSATADIQTLAWINTAPGMFVTGGQYFSDLSDSSARYGIDCS